MASVTEKPRQLIKKVEKLRNVYAYGGLHFTQRPGARCPQRIRKGRKAFLGVLFIYC